MELAVVVGVLTLIVGIAVKLIGFPDQIRKNKKRRSTEGLSATFIVLSFTSYTLWTLHGILSDDPVVAFGQGAGVVTTGIILLQIAKYRKRA